MALRAASEADVQRKLALLAPAMIKRSTGDATEPGSDQTAREYRFTVAVRDGVKGHVPVG